MLRLFKHLFYLFLFIASNAHAGQMDACYQANFKQLDRILDLPPEVIGLLYASSHGEKYLSSVSPEEKEKIQSGYYYLGIADRGGPFSPGCSPVGNEASLRLVMAAASEKCIFVAIEHGGAGHGAGMRVFLYQNESWVRGDQFDHPRAYLMYQGKYDTDLPSFMAQANYELGYAFKHGSGVNKDLVESLRWYLLSAEQGHEMAMFELGRIYAEGLGVEKDSKKAISWFEKAAANNPELNYRLGTIYIEGKLLQQDIKKGLKKIKSAIAKENLNAQVYMGKLHLSGEIVKQDYAEAIKLFRKSITRGGREQLARIYKEGLGVEKNNVVVWALLSGAGGSSYQEVLELQQQMSPSELEQAKRLKNDMDGYFSSMGSSSYAEPKGILTSLDAYLSH